MSRDDALVIGSDELRRYWQGHRSLTRRVIDAFPETPLFHYSVGAMRPFSELALEMIRLAEGGMRGLTSSAWDVTLPHVTTKADLLRLWDRTTQTIDDYWVMLPEDWYRRPYAAFGLWEAPGHSHVFYWIDNEIHHRGQAYVYLRSLGIAPPAFYERG